MLGDIHGGYRALVQCFKRSNFNPAADKLIFLGDATDGWSESPECVDALMQVNNLVYILGNHDIWILDWLLYDKTPDLWLIQGGRETIAAYNRHPWIEKKAEHLEFLSNQGKFYYLDDDNRLFVHGGFKPGTPIEKQEPELLFWDRNLFDETGGVPGFKEVYIGHTPTITSDADRPLNYGGPDNIWRLDTGAGWWGKLTILDVETKKFWQSDVVQSLYPGEEGRL